MSDKKIVEHGVHNFSKEESYIRPNEPILQERLEWFQDQKLGLMMHWGPYSQIGLVESWALSDHDAEWSRRGYDWEPDPAEFKRQYVALNKTFNPIRFQPKEWAKLAANSGFKYLIFTTKHHDGFSMWDTKETDYKITGAECPFHTHRYADVCRNLFDAFREQGLAIAAYFSKADWHSPYYWTPGMARSNPTWRGPSYKPADYPWLWEKFIEFTHNQILELLTDYGRIDILWLDAGWVCAKAGQDIRLEEVVEKARKKQPWLLSVDRTVGGPYENYVTPEQTIPSEVLRVPWESCISIGNSFSFAFGDEYKSGRDLVRLLVEIVAKGGNLALNVAPQPDGRLPNAAVKSMQELGEWLQVYGEAIYGTRICAPYFKDNCAFTRKGNVVYAIQLRSLDAPLEESIVIPFAEEASRVDVVGGREDVSTRRVADGLEIFLSDSERQQSSPIAHVFRISNV